MEIGEPSIAGENSTKKRKKAELEVKVVYVPDGKQAVVGATVNIKGPTKGTLKTDKNGIAIFKSLEPGTYNINAKYDTNHPVVNAARVMAKSKSQKWAVAANNPPYGPGTNKCNKFVYDMLKAGGSPPPMKLYKREILFVILRKYHYPPLARDWANGNVPGWSKVANPEPGDIIAEAIQYADATGHVGIVSYPKQANDLVSLSDGDKEKITLELQRQTISANSNMIVENDWGFRKSQSPTYMRR